jgi:hypothetical protein
MRWNGVSTFTHTKTKLPGTGKLTGIRVGGMHTCKEFVFVFMRTFATRLPFTQDRAFMFNRLRLPSAI